MPRCSGQSKMLSQRKRSRSAPAVLHSPAKKAKRKQWTDSQMISVMKAVQTGVMGVNEAAIKHGVPKTTLKDRLNNGVTHGTKSGPKQYLNNEEEELAEFQKDSAAVGYGKTRIEVMNIAESLAKKKGTLRKDKISPGCLVKEKMICH